jgi:hypothetical protein
MAVVGKIEEQNGQVDLRDRDQKNPIGKFSVDDLVAFFNEKKPASSAFKQKLEKNAFFSGSKILDELENQLQKDMFLGGFEASEKD